MTSTEPPPAALLPAGMMDLLPPAAGYEAATVSHLMRSFAGYGYERVKPPLIEFEDTLLADSGAALAPQTFRLMDPLSQRMLALRPDMTMQIARIAGSRLAHRPRPLRLSYAGQVVRLRGSQLRPERQFTQVGAELLGSAAMAADVEVVLMATQALAALGVSHLTVDLGVPTLVPAILEGRSLPEPVRTRLRLALDRKDIAAIRDLAGAIGQSTAATLATLIATSGPAEQAFAGLAQAALPVAAVRARDDTAAVIAGLRRAAPDLTLTVDWVESRGYEYHSGVAFALFARGVSGELGRGGHYRTVAAEDATGVTLFMDTVLEALPPPPAPRRLFLPCATAADVAAALRREGWIVVAGLDETEVPADAARRLGCTHVLVDDRPHEIAQDMPPTPSA